MKMIKENSILKRFFVLTVVVICLLFNFADCLASDSNVEITMWTFLNPNGTSGREIGLKKMIDSFEEKTGIKVIVETQKWDTLTAKFIAAHMTGNAPDISWLFLEEFGPVVEMGALVPFEDLFLDSWSNEDIEDIAGTLWDYGVVDGKHYQFSLSRNCFGFIYRDDLLKEKGITLPIKTWDEFIEVAQKLTEEDSESGIYRWGLGMGFSLDNANPMIATTSLLDLQGDLFTKDGKANWANDNGIKSVQLEVDMVRKYKVTPEDCILYTADDLYKDFAAGKYAMFIGSMVRTSKIKEEVSFNPDFVKLMPFPSWDGKASSPALANGWAVSVWSGSKHKKEAGQFVEYLVSKESDELWLIDGGQVPVRKSTLVKNIDFIEKPENSFLNTMAEIISTGYLPLPDISVAGWRMDLHQITIDVLSKGMSIEDALKNAENAFNKR